MADQMMQGHADADSQPAALTVHPARAPLRGVVAVPGDKSVSHRALILGGLAIGPTHITGLLEGDDVRRTATAMRALGCSVEREAGPPATWVVHGTGIGGLREPPDVLDMGNSGTAARLLCGVLATHPMVSVLTGDASLRHRPMARVVTPLLQSGAVFTAREGCRLPMAIAGTGSSLPLAFRMPVASAQVKSAVLLAGLNARGQTVVEEPVCTRDHTETMLAHFGADISVEPTDGAGRIIRLRGQPELIGAPITVPGDPSSAAFLLVAGLLVPDSALEVTGIMLNPLRCGLLTTLREMGAQIETLRERRAGGEAVADLRVRSTPLRAVDVPAARVPSMVDEYPILAVAAACARGTTRMRGLAELRVKESDRLAATARLLAANGVTVAIDGDDLLVTGTGNPPPGGGWVETRMDHRLAMSAIVLGLAAATPVRIDDVGFIATSFPGFIDLLNSLGAALGSPTDSMAAA